MIDGGLYIQYGITITLWLFACRNKFELGSYGLYIKYETTITIWLFSCHNKLEPTRLWIVYRFQR